MKPMLRWIPTEVWVDVFCYPWISRKKLGKLVDKFRNRYFAEILQYCLHERGKRTLGVFGLDEKILQILPQTPMPENIKFLEVLGICHFSSQTLDFLRNISTLFKDVNLLFHNIQSSDLAKLRVFLDHLTPLFHGINSLTFDRCAIPLVEQHFTAAKLAEVKMISLCFYIDPHFDDDDEDEPFDPATDNEQTVNYCLNWLTSEERDPAEPRLLEVYSYPEVQQFSMAVRQQFQSAKRPSTFAIKFDCANYNHDFDLHFDLKNTIGEQLHGQYGKEGEFWIYRHPSDSKRTQLEEWAKETVEKSDRSSGIELFSMLTVGQIEAGCAGDNEVNDTGKEEADQQPSTSEKH